MKLYKNVDICDLESILTQGLISIDAGAPNNWEAGQRSNNSTSVVYLFNPISDLNTFIQYGAVLLEVEVEDAIMSEFAPRDVNDGLYEEYVVEKVEPQQITSISIPKLLKSKASNYLSEDTMSRVNWVDIEANTYVGKTTEQLEKVKASQEQLIQWAQTIESISTLGFNYFRGMHTDGTILDLYEVKYI